MKYLSRIFVIAFISSLYCLSAFSADLPSLKKLFKQEFSTLYQARFCGRNIENFIKEANEKGIDLSNSYVLKIVGGGFLETSAFYTRNNRDKRAMLGYFHMVLVADGVVFDFDLAKPKALDINSYFRLQFTPPYEPFKIFGIDYTSKGNPGNWTLTGYNTLSYGRGGEMQFFSKKLRDYLDMKAIRGIDRSKL